MKEARVIVCNKRGYSYGDVCHTCIVMGEMWVKIKVKQIMRRRIV